MGPNSPVGELIEKGQNATSNAAKTIISDTANSVSGQIGLKNEANVPQVSSQTQQVQPQPSQGTEQVQNSSQNQADNEFTKEMVQDFYSPSVTTPQYVLEEQEKAQTEQKLLQIRQKLHQERHNEVYFNAILNADAPKKQEERPAEKVERQQMEDLQTLEDKKKNELPIAVLRGQTHAEVNPGIAG